MNYLITLIKSFSLVFKASLSLALITLILIILSGIIPSLMIDLSKDIINGFNAKSIEINLFIIWSILFLINNLINIFTDNTSQKLADKSVKYLNINLMKKINSFQTLVNLENPKLQDDINILKSQATTRPVNLIFNLSYSLRYGAIVISMLILLYNLNHIIPFIIIVTILPTLLLIRHINTIQWQATQDKSLLARKMAYYSSVMLSPQMVKELKLFDIEKKFIKQYEQLNDNVYQHFNKIRNNKLLISLPIQLISFVGTLYIMLLLGKEAKFDNLSLGELAVFTQAFFQINYYLADLVNNIGYMQNIMQYYEKYFNFMKQNNINATKNDLTIKTIKNKKIPYLLFEKVNFSYPDCDKLILKNLSFSLNKGQTIAIVGENGAGKTSIIKVLLGFYPIQSGNIFYQGKNINSLNIKEYRAYYSAVFQDFNKYHTSLAHNINPVDFKAELDDKMLDICHKFKLNQLIKANKNYIPIGRTFGGRELSSGQWQKLAIARAIYRNSEIIILDEPTSSLDPIIEAEIYNDFKTIVKNKTSILITHRLGSTIKADKILVLENGNLIEQGNHTELMQKQEKYYQMFNSQASFYQ